MGSLTTVERRDLDPPRARLLAAVRERRFGLKELSAEIGKNASYLQQYLVKGSPRTLPESVRLELARVLEVPEEELRHQPGQVPSVKPLPSHMSGPLLPPPGRRIPSHKEGMPIRLEIPTAGRVDLTEVMQGFGEDCQAITLTRSHGMLQPRHMLICDPSETIRMGDLAAVIADGQFVGVGVALPAEPGHFSWTAGGSAKAMTRPLDQAFAWRVVAIRTAG